MIVKKYKGHDVPEGATHYGANTRDYVEGFYDADSNFWRLPHDNIWMKTNVVSDRSDLIELPQEPEQYMPKVGEGCEYTAIRDGDGQYSSILAGTWYECTKIIAFHDGCVWTSDNGIRPLKNTIFRPIKTEREKVIGWHLVNMGYDSDEFNFEGAEESLVFITLSLLFKGGHLAIPEAAK